MFGSVRLIDGQSLLYYTIRVLKRKHKRAPQVSPDTLRERQTYRGSAIRLFTPALLFVDKVYQSTRCCHISVKVITSSYLKNIVII